MVCICNISITHHFVALQMQPTIQKHANFKTLCQYNISNIACTNRTTVNVIFTFAVTRPKYCRYGLHVKHYIINQSINQSRVTHICVYAKSASQNIRVISYQRIKSSNIFIHLRLSVNYDSVSFQTTVWTIP